jgi:HEAT repeat protein
MTLRGIKSVLAVGPLMEIFLDKDESPDLRANAGSALTGYRLVDSEGALLELLKEDGVGIRIVTLHRLAEIGSEKANEAIIDSTRDEDNWVRINALTLLENIETDRTLGILVEALKDDAWGVRNHAAKALVEKGAQVVHPLIRVLDDDGWPETSRRYTCWILSKIESMDVLGALTEALRDESWLVRNEAAVSLARINHEMSVEPLKRMLKDEKPHVREEAAWVLGEMKRDEATESLIEMLNGRNDGAWMAAIALGKIGPVEAAASLIKALGDNDVQLRRAAAWALCRVKSTDAVEPLTAALKDDDQEVRFWASEALKRTNDSFS